jgi:hypothetical protein
MVLPSNAFSKPHRASIIINQQDQIGGSAARPRKNKTTVRRESTATYNTRGANQTHTLHWNYTIHTDDTMRTPATIDDSKAPAVHKVLSDRMEAPLGLELLDSVDVLPDLVPDPLGIGPVTLLPFSFLGSAKS